MRLLTLFSALWVPLTFWCQTPTNVMTTTILDEVIVASSRISLPLSKNSRFIQVISQEAIARSGVPHVADLLQQVAGLDVRRRGVAGMQADLHIRGGGFDQTLLLVDGIKLEDPQTGHHLLNFAPPIEAIERIEIIKGPAARIYGGNAFTGAINIVTKKGEENQGHLGMQAGSFGQIIAEATLSKTGKKANFLGHYRRNVSEGYRYNTDFENHQFFLKGRLAASKAPIDILGFFNDREFGANGFYALPSYAEQYEETQASLIAIQSKIEAGAWQFRPRLYWRRGQDMYLFLRDNPSFYRNLHITHKAGFAFDATRQHNHGSTGIGIDISQISISSNNLGDRTRWVGNVFVEHQWESTNDRWQITPGVAVTQYSDFDAYFFPGIDLGYVFSDSFRMFANSGYTYRIPTFTDLYYSDPTTLGNENLAVEEALTHELGFRWLPKKFQLTSSLFYRTAENLIDYIQNTEEGPFQATNIRSVNTLGWEVSAKGVFHWHQKPHQWSVGYTYLSDDLKSLTGRSSRYSINSLRHQLSVNYWAQWTRSLATALQYRWADRVAQDPYTVVDLTIQWQLDDLQLSFIANNIFNARYSESNLVPMPLGNGLLGLRVDF